MQIITTDIPEVVIIEPKLFGDARGFFLETYHKVRYQQHGINEVFVQDNHSRSAYGVLRGLHCQKQNPQGKLVSVTRGRVFDVAVDIRYHSPYFGQWVSAILDDEHHRQLYIPPGFAHGFCVLSDDADFCYKCTAYYDPSDEIGIRYNDPQLNINWPVANPSLSAKDSQYPCLADLNPELLPTYKK